MNKDTFAMLQRLTALGISTDDAYALRRISMTLQRWFELECGDGNDHGSWCITRGRKSPRVFKRDPESQAPAWEGGEFIHDDDGAPYMERHSHNANGATYTRIADREAGARKRLAAIMARYEGFTAYVQTDPRGCALYILPPGSLKPGEDVSAYYNARGVAVFK